MAQEMGLIMRKFGLSQIFKKYTLRISITLFLVVCELVTMLLFPLFIGNSLNGLLSNSYSEIGYLICLILASVLFGSSRRFIDSRVYSSIFRETAQELFAYETDKGSETSKINARMNLLTELVEFFENSFPEIISNFLGLAGVLVIIATIDTAIFLLCMIVLVFIIIVYGLSSRKYWRFSKEQNDFSERTVAIIQEKDGDKLKVFLKNIMGVNIKLSDLETKNYSVVTVVSMAIYITSMILIVDKSSMNYGEIFTVLMYVYEFVEKSIYLPLYYQNYISQNYIRLKEISYRLSQ